MMAQFDNTSDEQELSVQEQETDFLLYTTPEADVRVELIAQNETVWLSQKRMAALYDTTKQNIGQHLKRIFEEGELEKDAVVKKFFTTAADGKEYQVKFYNLDAIIAVGYRVNSHRATQFRIWATEKLREFMIKGFVLDDERLKNGRYFGKDYFQELLERVRSIRASERRMYQQITDIFAECSVDYDPRSQEAKDFFAMVQNKFHYAITGKTAAETIQEKVDRDAPNIGLQTWKNAPEGRILKSDVGVGKNYLSEDELKKLERTVSGFFDYIERIIENRTSFTMAAFAESVDKFLAFNEYEVLDHKGSISSRQAKEKAKLEYEAFDPTQPIESDFDKFVAEVQMKGGRDE